MCRFVVNVVVKQNRDDSEYNVMPGYVGRSVYRLNLDSRD